MPDVEGRGACAHEYSSYLDGWRWRCNHQHPRRGMAHEFGAPRDGASLREHRGTRAGPRRDATPTSTTTTAGLDADDDAYALARCRRRKQACRCRCAAEPGPDVCNLQHPPKVTLIVHTAQIHPRPRLPRGGHGCNAAYARPRAPAAATQNIAASSVGAAERDAQGARRLAIPAGNLSAEGTFHVCSKSAGLRGCRGASSRGRFSIFILSARALDVAAWPLERTE